MKYCICLVILFFTVLSRQTSGQIPERQTISNHIDSFAILHSMERTAALDNSNYLYRNTSDDTALSNSIRKAMLNLIVIDCNVGQYQQALTRIDKLLKYCDSSKNRDIMAISYFFKGSIYRRQSMLRNAFENYSKALTFAKDSVAFLFVIYHDMGDILNELSQYQKALPFFNTAIRYARYANYFPETSLIYTNMGKAFQGLNAFKESERSFDSAIVIARRYNNLGYLASALSFKANLYNETGQAEKALMAIQEVESVSRNYNISRENYLYLIAGDTYTKLHQLALAKQYYQRSRALSEGTSLLVYSVASQRLADLCFKTGNYKRAYLLLHDSRKILDSIINKEVKLNVNDLETKYRTAEKDKEIAVKNLKISESERKIAKKNNVILSVVFSSVILAMIGLWTYLYQRKKAKSEKEIEHLKGIIEGEEKERTRLAHDLHDGVNSQLSAVQSFLLAEENIHPFLADAQNFTAAQNLIHETALNVRRMAHNLAPESLLNKGLPNVVKEFCIGIFTGRGIRPEVTVYGEFKDINISLSLSLYRIIQELAQNIVKHSNATEATIILYREEQQIILIAEDNGTGIPEEVLQVKEKKGIGLSGLEERIKMHRGTLSVESVSGQGTTIHITFPLSSNLYAEPAKA